MIPVYQTLFGKGGDCFRACVASILEVKIESLPNFCSWNEETWFKETAAYLVKKFPHVDDFMRVAISADESLFQTGIGNIGIDDLDLNVPDCLVLQDVKTPRGRLHSVVSKYSFDGEKVNMTLVHDPHPEAGEIWPEHKHVLAFYAIVGKELWLHEE